MGVDQRGVNRGKCKVADCDCADFHLVEGAIFCGYCGDPPAKHQVLELGATLSNGCSETVLGTDSVPQSKERWMNQKYGYIPNAKRETGLFYNEVLKSFYQSYWPYCPHEKNFHQAFIIERNRRWYWKKKITYHQQQLATFKSINPAYAGRYLEDNGSYIPHKDDFNNINRLIHNLESMKVELDKAMTDIKHQDDSLFTVSGKLKSGRDSNHTFNEEYINKIRETLLDIKSVFSQLNKRKELFISVWKHKFNNTSSERKMKQRTRQNKWKIKNRSQKQLRSRMVHIFTSLGGEPIGGEISPSCGINQITDIDENTLYSLCTRPRDKQCLQNLLDEGCFRMDALNKISNYM